MNEKYQINLTWIEADDLQLFGTLNSTGVKGEKNSEKNGWKECNRLEDTVIACSSGASVSTKLNANMN